LVFVLVVAKRLGTSTALALERGWPAPDGTIHLILGDAYFEQRKLKEARTAFREALRRSPDSAAARRAIARINEILGAG